jgi:hypothetical protein
MVGLWKRGELTDVILVASDGCELAAHRAILGGHSQVFPKGNYWNSKNTHICWLILQKYILIKKVYFKEITRL